MRTLLLVLALACCFGVAAIWQQSHIRKLHEERVLAAEQGAGRTTATASGLLDEDQAVIWIGSPAGVAPNPAAPNPPRTEAGSAADNAPPAPAPPAPPAPVADFELEVAAGQSLSKIAHAHYGRAPVELVTKLAQYNGMRDPNALRAGMRLKLPPLERLGLSKP